jgi:hypothetical protein
MDARLPLAVRLRYQRRVNRRSDRLGLLLGVAVLGGSVVLTSQQLHVDVHGVVSLPASLGVTTLLGVQPRHGHPGFAAPLVKDASQPGCDPERPTFVLGMAELKQRIGLEMGAPVECEHTINTDDDSVQRTTTGVASFIQNTHMLTFADGLHYWALSGGVLTRRIQQYPADDYSER